MQNQRHTGKRYAAELCRQRFRAVNWLRHSFGRHPTAEDQNHGLTGMDQLDLPRPGKPEIFEIFLPAGGFFGNEPGEIGW